jgi:hypothetical protein
MALVLKADSFGIRFCQDIKCQKIENRETVAFKRSKLIAET